VRLVVALVLRFPRHAWAAVVWSSAALRVVCYAVIWLGILGLLPNSHAGSQGTPGYAPAVPDAAWTQQARDAALLDQLERRR
jgi:hypothetical protein